MFDAELIFFMAPPDEAFQKIVSTRLRPGQPKRRPESFPDAPPAIYTAPSITKNFCGPNSIMLSTSRLINTDGKEGSQIAKSLAIGQEIEMIYAGVQKIGVDETDDYNQT